MIRILACAAALIVFSSAASSHTIPWRSDVSRSVGFGHCAKGPCMRRTSFAASVPHRHVGDGKCQGAGASGYRFGKTFAC
jgi:hypothetical protein